MVLIDTIYLIRNVTDESQELDAGTVGVSESGEGSESGSSSKSYNSEDTESEEDLDVDEDQEMGSIPAPVSGHLPGLDIPVQVEEQPVTNAPNLPSNLCKFDSFHYVIGFLIPNRFCAIASARTAVLIATNQTEFTMDAIPTRHGRPRKTRDMGDIYACICGNVVEKEARVTGSDMALRCAFEGCETLWVRFSHRFCLHSTHFLPSFSVNSFI